VNAGGGGEDATDGCSGLTDGDLKLLKLIEELGEYFNSEDGAVRAKCKYLVSSRGYH
jgi:DNA repair/transcription protein MET18/MMS19